MPRLIFMPLLTGWDFLKAQQPHVRVLLGRCRIYILASSLALADTAKANDHIFGIRRYP